MIRISITYLTTSLSGRSGSPFFCARNGGVGFSKFHDVGDAVGCSAWLCCATDGNTLGKQSPVKR
jgi:hypothetical protein